MAGVTYRDSRGRFRKATAAEKRNAGGFRWTDTSLFEGIANFERKTGDRIGEAAKDFAADLLQYAQNNAPWEDRTGDARSGLYADVNLDSNDLTIELGHTVDYGIWLEIRWGGRYAIIIPTIEQMGPELYYNMRGMCAEITYYVD